MSNIEDEAGRKSKLCYVVPVILLVVLFYFASIGIDFGAVAVLFFVVVIVLALGISGQNITSYPYSRPQRNVHIEFEIICDDSNTKSFSEIKEQLRKDIAEVGWQKVRKKFMNEVRDGFGTQWYSENLFLVKILEIDEYLGYDGSIFDLLREVRSGSNISELAAQVVQQLIPKVLTQIQIGGNTAFLDIEKIREDESALLVPIILEKRKENFLAAMDKFRSLQCTMNNLSEVLTTNYGFIITNAIKKKTGLTTNLEQIVTQLDVVYDRLMKDRSSQTISSPERMSSPWLHLCSEIAMDHISRLTGEKFDIPFQYCNPSFMMLYQSGYRSIFKVLEGISSYPKLYKGEYKFILSVLKDIKTKRASIAQSILITTDWKAMYVQY